MRACAPVFSFVASRDLRSEVDPGRARCEAVELVSLQIADRHARLNTARTAFTSPGAPSVVTVVGMRRPRSAMSRKNEVQQLSDSLLPPARCSRCLRVRGDGPGSPTLFTLGCPAVGLQCSGQSATREGEVSECRTGLKSTASTGKPTLPRYSKPVVTRTRPIRSEPAASAATDAVRAHATREERLK